MGLFEQTELRRVAASARLDGRRRARLGQFFTPEPVARIMGKMLYDVPGDVVRILDPGAGVGSLSAAAVEALCAEGSDRRSIEVAAYEIDDTLHGPLSETLSAAAELAESAGRQLSWKISSADYILDIAGRASSLLGVGEIERFGAVIINPPYRKINGRSPERAAVERVGLRTTNLYTAFLALAAVQLVSDGLLVAITPRSFANGLYFEPFRHFFFDRVGLERLHTFASRGALFADADVLQENIIFSARRGQSPAEVELAVSRSSNGEPERRRIPAGEIVRPDDRHRFLRIPTEIDDVYVAQVMADMPCELSALGVGVSTGRVVDFRAREYLRDEPEDLTAPLIYPGHLKDGGVRWPGTGGFRKPNALAIDVATEKLLLPNETYVLVKRFSAKEERRRVSAAVSSSSDLPGSVVAFENHLNVFHSGSRGIESRLARGLAGYLNSSIVDQYVRQFNGHTQVNATDLRHLRYPTVEQLTALGSAVLDGDPRTQAALDQLVEAVLPVAGPVGVVAV
jgi:adenine-specific DNA-methyltransferase